MNTAGKVIRWSIVLLCVLLGASLAVYPLTLAESKVQLAALAGPAALLFAAAAVGGWPRVGGAAALMIVAEYALALIIARPDIDLAAIALATGLFLELELLDLARLTARGAAIQKGVVASRARYALGVALVGAVVGTAALWAGALAGGGNALLLLAGGAAAVAAVWLVVTLAGRAVEEP